MDRPIAVRMTPAQPARWWAVVLCVIGLGAVVTPIIMSKHRGAETQASELAAPCRDWDAIAGDAIIARIRSSSDADLRGVGDSVFRMRRARRNCMRRWVTLACQDYQAIVRRAPGRVLAGDALASCETSMAAMAANE